MSTAPEEFTVHCPNCDSTLIYEKNIAYAELEVFAWEVDDGNPVPSDYDTDSSPQWECADVADQYVCHGCNKWSGASEDLIVKRVSASPSSAEGNQP